MVPNSLWTRIRGQSKTISSLLGGVMLGTDHGVSPPLQGYGPQAPQLCSQQRGAKHALLKEEGSSGCLVSVMISLGNVECPLNSLHPRPEIPFASLQMHPVIYLCGTPFLHSLCTHSPNVRKYVFFIGTVYESFLWRH